MGKLKIGINGVKSTTKPAKKTQKSWFTKIALGLRLTEVSYDGSCKVDKHNSSPSLLIYFCISKVYNLLKNILQ